MGNKQNRLSSHLDGVDCAVRRREESGARSHALELLRRVDVRVVAGVVRRALR